MKNRVAIIILTLVTIGALPMQADPIRAPQGRRSMRANDGIAGILGRTYRLRQKLGLSSAQVDQIRAIFRQLREQNAGLREQRRAASREIARALIENPDNLDAARALASKRMTADQTMRANALVGLSRAMKVLTAEQREELGELLERRRGRPSP